MQGSGKEHGYPAAAVRGSGDGHRVSVPQVTMLSEELKLASPDLDAIERWRAKEAECARRVAELDGVRGEREGVRSLDFSPENVSGTRHSPLPLDACGASAGAEACVIRFCNGYPGPCLEEFASELCYLRQSADSVTVVHHAVASNLGGDPWGSGTILPLKHRCGGSTTSCGRRGWTGSWRASTPSA